MQCFGCSQDGEALFVEFKKNDDSCDVNFMLRLKDGTYLTIPGRKNTIR